MSFASWVGSPSVGTASGADLVGVFGGQSLLFGPVDTSNPIVLGSFAVTATQEGVLSYTLGTISPPALGALFTTQVTTSATGDTNIFTTPGAAGYSLIAGTVQIVPTPGVLTLAAMGGLAAARRRR